MANIRNRLERLEANAPGPADAQVTEIQRIIMGRTNADGSPFVIVRKVG